MMKKWAGVALVVLGCCGPSPTGGLEAQGPSPARQGKPTAEALDLLLAPIALYPDQLLAQILLCATSPDTVRELDVWMKSMPTIKGTALQEAAQKAGFEPSFVALALFPQVVGLMAGDLPWTTQVGQAFSSDRSGVFDSIQRLRAQSQAVGNLTSTPQQDVETRTTSAGQQVIVIEPANPQVVYVPQYDPQVVYTQPATSNTVVVEQESDDGAAVAAGVVGFAAGIAIGAAIDNDYYYGPYGWRGGAYMYNDAWDDWYDHREDAREDWYDHREDAREDYQDRREDVAGERTDRASSAQQQRTERQQTRQTTASETGRASRGETQATAAERTGSTAARTQSAGTSSYTSRGHSRTEGVSAERAGTRSDAFSGYSSGKSERAASARGKTSRSGGGGGGGGRRSGGGRRR